MLSSHCVVVVKLVKFFSLLLLLLLSLRCGENQDESCFIIAFFFFLSLLLNKTIRTMDAFILVSFSFSFQRSSKVENGFRSFVMKYSA